MILKLSSAVYLKTDKHLGGTPEKVFFEGICFGPMDKFSCIRGHISCC